MSDKTKTLFDELRAMAIEHDIVIVTAKQKYPSGGWPSWIPRPEFIIVDYMDILRPTRAS
jgi:hypothetical protein